MNDPAAVKQFVIMVGIGGTVVIVGPPGSYITLALAWALAILGGLIWAPPTPSPPEGEAAGDLEIIGILVLLTGGVVCIFMLVWLVMVSIPCENWHLTVACLPPR